MAYYYLWLSDESLPYFARALNIYEEKLGRSHPTVNLIATNIDVRKHVRFACIDSTFKVNRGIARNLRVAKESGQNVSLDHPKTGKKVDSIEEILDKDELQRRLDQNPGPNLTVQMYKV
jgi:hypothetical protein